MGPPIAPPDWMLADVREQIRAWADERPVARGLAAAVVFGVVLLGTRATSADVPAEPGALVRALLIGGAVGLGLGLAVGHVLAAGRHYSRHVLTLPRLLAGVVRPPSAAEATTGAMVGVLAALTLPPLAAIALGVAVLLLTPTGPGVAAASATGRALDVVRADAGSAPRGNRALASVFAIAGVAAPLTALLRILWADGAACGVGRLGVPCGAEHSLWLAIAAGVAAWTAVPLGAAVSRSLDVALRPSDVVAVPTAEPVEAPAADLPAITEAPATALDDLVDLVRARFAELSGETRAALVSVVSRTLDGDVRVDVGQDVLDVLEDAVRQAGAERTVEAIGALEGHAETMGGLRRQYQRTPKVARSAVERTAVTATRASGVPRDIAGPAVRTLLTMPDQDWATMTRTLNEVTSRFAGSDA